MARGSYSRGSGASTVGSRGGRACSYGRGAVGSDSPAAESGSTSPVVAPLSPTPPTPPTPTSTAQATDLSGASFSSAHAQGSTSTVRPTITHVDFARRNDVKEAITSILKKHFVEAKKSYTKVSEPTRLFWSREFQKKFSWDCAMTHAIKKAYDTKASDWYRWRMHRAKQNDKKSDFMTDDQWREMKVEGQSLRTWWPASRHNTTGSMPTQMGLRTRIGVAPLLLCSTPRDWGISCRGSRLRKRHSRNAGSPREKWPFWKKRPRVVEEYDAMMEQATQGIDGESEPSISNIDPLDVWRQAVGGFHKGRLYGMGSLAKEIDPSTGSGSSSAPPPPPSQQQWEQQQQEMQRL